MSGQVGTLSITSRKVPDPIGLLSWLPCPQGTLSWVNGGEGLVGWGEAARFSPSGPGRFAEAQRWWSAYTADLRVHDELGVLGSGPVAFVSMAFADHPGDSVLIVPKVVVGRRDGVTWMTTVGEDVPPHVPIEEPTGVRYEQGAVSDAADRRSVASAVARIRGGELDKVVLARDLVATAEAALDERYLLCRLADGYATCFVFAVAGLVGATPELLLRRNGDTVSARLLAGTVWPKPGTLDGAELAQELLTSAKNRGEHQFVVRSLVETLAPFCLTLDVAPEPSVLHLTNVSHLATDVRGTSTENISLLEVLAQVHPTAAVSGAPTTEALRLIRDLEKMDRGGYLGPVGWLDARGNGEFGVALRCAQVKGATARLFAGGGIVADSDPDTEAEEVVAKFQAMQFALDH